MFVVYRPHFPGVTGCLDSEDHVYNTRLGPKCKYPHSQEKTTDTHLSYHFS